MAYPVKKQEQQESRQQQGIGCGCNLEPILRKRKTKIYHETCRNEKKSWARKNGSPSPRMRQFENSNRNLENTKTRQDDGQVQDSGPRSALMTERGTSGQARRAPGRQHGTMFNEVGVGTSPVAAAVPPLEHGAASADASKAAATAASMDLTTLTTKINSHLRDHHARSTEECQAVMSSVEANLEGLMDRHFSVEAEPARVSEMLLFHVMFAG